MATVTGTHRARQAARARLIRLLQAEHANERAAALAYRGHAASVRDAEEREAIKRIEQEEWHHREVLAKMLAELGAAPVWWRERVTAVVGSFLGVMCHLVGWLAPMYGAGLIERVNVTGYRRAVSLAHAANLPELVAPLEALGAVEEAHERYFRDKVRSHRFARWLPLWPPPHGAQD